MLIDPYGTISRFRGEPSRHLANSRAAEDHLVVVISNDLEGQQALVMTLNPQAQTGINIDDAGGLSSTHCWVTWQRTNSGAGSGATLFSRRKKPSLPVRFRISIAAI